MNTGYNILKNIAMHMFIVICALGTAFSPVLHATDQSGIFVDGNGWTELHRLVGSGSLNFFDYNNVDLCLKRNPLLRLAKTVRGDAPLHVLIEAQCMLGTISNLDYQSNIVKIIKALVSTEYEVKPGKKVRSGINIQNSLKETALHLAAGYGLDYIITLLLAHGADKEALTVAKNTPLNFAVGRGHLSSVRLLLDSGARCSEKTISLAQERIDFWRRKDDAEGIEIYIHILEELLRHRVA
ncbi:MAG: ankyrin repeat domain-containing protein [bacterium]